MSSNRNQKYIIVKGVPVKNPDYQAPAGSLQPTTSSVPANPNALPIAATLEDQAAMSQLTSLPAPQQLQDAINTMQSPDYVANFQSQGLTGDLLLDGLMRVFSQNEIPVGLISKLTPLQGATLHFKIDDSGSMANGSNLYFRDACLYTRQSRNAAPNQQLTRWEEAQDRMHTLIELLVYVPTGPIILSFFDHQEKRRPGDRILLERNGRMPEDCLQAWHEQIRSLFASHSPDGNTPILYNMQNMLREANALRVNTDSLTMHYVLTDGEPNGKEEEIDQIKDFLNPELNTRNNYRGANTLLRNPQANPFTFLGCSDRRSDYRWMHEVEEVAKCVAALPDFRDELLEVRTDQGTAFPYTRGFWLLCNIAAAINPDDLDALDQHAPFTKKTLESLLGRGIMEDEYRRYFVSHPTFTDRRLPVFEPDYQQFLTAEVARDIVNVQIFMAELARLLKADMARGRDDTEAQREREVEDLIISRRPKPAPIAPVTQNYGAMYAGNNNNNVPAAPVVTMTAPPPAAPVVTTTAPPPAAKVTVAAAPRNSMFSQLNNTDNWANSSTPVSQQTRRKNKGCSIL